ncbi:MbtH family NRPS accessory protein [Nonomuraea sp. NPDC005692]|uniref:MbtH family protein n=1 Tax=Nonomuraea sp. NPDC005692 TaxID=3157168 RepID=UPI003401F9E0
MDDFWNHCRVLVNDEGAHSLWPASAAVPDGWRVVYRNDVRQRCLEYITGHWTDITPDSLVDAIVPAE